MQSAQERSSFYVDQIKILRELEVGQKVFWKVTP